MLSMFQCGCCPPEEYVDVPLVDTVAVIQADGPVKAKNWSPDTNTDNWNPNSNLTAQAGQMNQSMPLQIPDDAQAREMDAKENAEKDLKKREAQKKLEARRAEDAARKQAREKEEEAKRQRLLKEAKERQEQEEKEMAAKRNANLGPLAAPGARVQVQLDDGWKDMPEDCQKQIRDQLGGGDTKFVLQSKHGMHVIDWANKTQTNPQSKKTRNLRVHTP